MSYQSQAQLAADSDWNGRAQSAATQQANTYLADDRPDWVALAQGVLRGELDKLSTFVRTTAAAPGFADTVDNGDGTIDQAAVVDDDLVAATQAAWQVIAPLYYAADGSPL
jgi:hypothetical protein